MVDTTSNWTAWDGNSRDAFPHPSDVVEVIRRDGSTSRQQVSRTNGWCWGTRYVPKSHEIMFYRLVDAPNTAEPEPAPDHELSPEKTVMGLLRRANVHIDAINNMLSNEFLALKKHLERMEASLPKSEIHNTYIYHGQHQGGVADVALMLRSVNLADIWKNEVKAKSENESAPEIRPSEKTEMQSDWHRRMTFVPRYESPAKTQPEPAPETRSEADRLREVLNIFRAFVTRNVLKWNEGTCIGHPMWELLTKAIGGEPKIYDGPAWQFIQPDNRERLATLKDRRRSKGDVL